MAHGKQPILLITLGVFALQNDAPWKPTIEVSGAAFHILNDSKSGGQR
jgi:hypothetical protein